MHLLLLPALYNDTQTYCVQCLKMRSFTCKGKPCHIFKNNKFALKHEGKKLNTWTCTVKSCETSIHTDKDDVIQENSAVHNHEDTVPDVAVHQLKVSCKRLGLEDFDTPPSKVVRKEIQKLGEESKHVTVSDLSSCKMLLWRSRTKTCKKRPKSAHETVQAVQQIPLSTSRKEDFLMHAECMNTDDGIIVFTCKTNLHVLCESDVILGDGTFYVTPPFFHQMYTFHVYSDGNYLPLIFALLPDKQESTYTNLIKISFDQCFKMSLHFPPKLVILDFEIFFLILT